MLRFNLVLWNDDPERNRSETRQASFLSQNQNRLIVGAANPDLATLQPPWLGMPGRLPVRRFGLAVDSGYKKFWRTIFELVGFCSGTMVLVWHHFSDVSALKESRRGQRRMAGMFACPECGQPLKVDGLSPGRHVLCDYCSTWVEVPYLPRALPRDRGRGVKRGASAWNSPLLKVAIAFAVLALGLLILVKSFVGRVKSDREKVLTELITSAKEAATDRRHDVALREIESAMAQARSMGLEGSDRFDDLITERNRIALNELSDRLDALDRLDPDTAVGEARTLAEKIDKNKALDSLSGRVDTALNAALGRRAQSDLKLARTALDLERDNDAVASALRLHEHAGDLGGPDGTRFQDEAMTILETAVARSGVAMPVPSGRFAVGSADTYARLLEKPIFEPLKARGFVPEPPGSIWSRVWRDKARFALLIQVNETQDDLYLQSNNRNTQIDATFEMFKEDRAIWKNRVVAKTREPLPDLPAGIAGHLAVAKRNPETERRLHDDAIKFFTEQASRIFRGLPSKATALKAP